MKHLRLKELRQQIETAFVVATVRYFVVRPDCYERLLTDIPISAEAFPVLGIEVHKKEQQRAAWAFGDATSCLAYLYDQTTEEALEIMVDPLYYARDGYSSLVEKPPTPNAPLS